MGKLCTRPHSMRNQNQELSPVLIEMITLHCLIKIKQNKNPNSDGFTGKLYKIFKD